MVYIMCSFQMEEHKLSNTKQTKMDINQKYLIKKVAMQVVLVVKTALDLETEPDTVTVVLLVMVVKEPVVLLVTVVKEPVVQLVTVVKELVALLVTVVKTEAVTLQVLCPFLLADKLAANVLNKNLYQAHQPAVSVASAIATAQTAVVTEMEDLETEVIAAVNQTVMPDKEVQDWAVAQTVTVLLRVMVATALTLELVATVMV